jgi:DNA primase
MDIPRLHPDTIEEVKNKVDIIDVVGEHIVLKKRGKDYLGSCPFHQEKSPSFSVSPTKQMYYCFGCQAGGNAISFLMEVGKQSFTEVVLDLARKYQISIQTLAPEQRQELQRKLSLREQVYEILAIAANFYQHALNQSQGANALNYLKAERGFSDETIQEFQLGYSPAGWDTLANYLIEQKQFPGKAVEAAGMIIPRKDGNSYYDRFRDRLMIPIRDLRGRVIGFGGRTLSDEQPKYLNSPETELFDKGKTLYGLDRAKDAINKTDRAVVVEGYFDVIALHAAGIMSAVAALGTALSLAQVKQLAKFTDSKQIILNFDADKAGNIAAERAIGEVATLAYQGQVQLRVINLPSGKDADEFLKLNSRDAYLNLLDNAPLWLDWQIQQAIDNRDLTQAEQYQQATKKIVELLANITDSNTRAHYLKHSAGLLSASETRMIPLTIENLQTAIKKFQPVKVPYTSQTTQGYTRSPQLEPPPEVEYTDEPDATEEIAELVTVDVHPSQRLLEQAESLLLRIYLHYPTHRLTIIDELDSAELSFTLAHHQFLWDKIIAHSSQATAQPEESDYLDDRLIIKLQDLKIEYPAKTRAIEHLFHLDEHTAQEIQRSPLVLRAAIACLEKSTCERRCQAYLNKLKSQDPEDIATQKDTLAAYLAVKQRLQQLQQQRVVTISDLIEN